MRETERYDNRQNKVWNPDRQSDKQAIIDREQPLDNRGASDRSLRTRYNQEAITQPLRRPSDDEIVPPARH